MAIRLSREQSGGDDFWLSLLDPAALSKFPVKDILAMGAQKQPASLWEQIQQEQERQRKVAEEAARRQREATARKNAEVERQRLLREAAEAQYQRDIIKREQERLKVPQAAIKKMQEILEAIRANSPKVRAARFNDVVTRAVGDNGSANVILMWGDKSGLTAQESRFVSEYYIRPRGLFRLGGPFTSVPETVLDHDYYYIKGYVYQRSGSATHMVPGRYDEVTAQSFLANPSPFIAYAAEVLNDPLRDRQVLRKGMSYWRDSYPPERRGPPREQSISL